MNNIFKTDQDIQSSKAIEFAFKSLKAEWNYPDDFIMKVSKQFECATEGNIYLDILDGSDDSESAWETYCSTRGIEHEIEFNPF